MDPKRFGLANLMLLTSVFSSFLLSLEAECTSFKCVAASSSHTCFTGAAGICLVPAAASFCNFAESKITRLQLAADHLRCSKSKRSSSDRRCLLGGPPPPLPPGCHVAYPNIHLPNRPPCPCATCMHGLLPVPHLPLDQSTWLAALGWAARRAGERLPGPAPRPNLRQGRQGSPSRTWSRS